MTKQFQTGMPRLSLAPLVVPKVEREAPPRPHPRDRAISRLIHGDVRAGKAYLQTLAEIRRKAKEAAKNESS